jgi:7,8-dihydro-6-hydroxymethylpterin dimethyltransferase
MTATLTKWYEEHGRHEIFAGGKAVPLGTREHSLVLNAEAVAKGAQTDLDELGIAKNAREEKLQARKKEQDPRYHTDMERLYRQHVLKEPAAPVISLQSLKAPKKEQTV